MGLYDLPTIGAQTLQALGRYPDRTAFVWPGGTLTYRGATDLIGRIQQVFMRLNLAPGTRVAFLTANRADTWCAGVAAALSRCTTTWLHPLGSLDDQLFQIEDLEARVLVVDPDAFHDRGGELASKSNGLVAVFTIGRAGFGVDLLAAAESAGAATAKCFAKPDDDAVLVYTGGTTGRSKGALRQHQALCELRRRDPCRLRVSRYAALSHGCADQPCRGHKSAADPDARRHRAHDEGFRSRGGAVDHRARKDQLHAVRADHDLRAAGSSLACEDRSLLAGARAVWRFADGAEPACGRHRADRAGVLAALRPDRVLSGFRAAQDRPRSEAAGAVPVVRFPDRRL